MTRRIIIIALLLCTACKKEFTQHLPVDTSNQMAFVKIVHASLLYGALNVYIGGEKVNGAALSFNAVYPVTGTNTYLAVKPGNQEIKLLAADSSTIFSFTKQLGAAKYYSFFITDSLTNASRDSSRIIVEDVLPKIAPGFVGLRFINAVLNDTGMVALWSVAKNGVIISKVKPDSVSSFISVGFNAQIADTLYVTRNVADTVPFIRRTVLAKFVFNSGTIPTLVDGRNYSLYYKGDANATTGATARSVAGYVH
jgi:hypothetical protein